MSDKPNLTIEEVKELKKELTLELIDLFVNFQRRTGLVIKAVNLEHEDIYHFDSIRLMERKITKLHIETELI